MTVPDSIEQLLVEVRADTQGFAQDVAQMRASFDGTLVDGFSRAGTVLERGLLGALRKGSLGFDDLKRIAFNVLDEIAGQALQGLFSGSSGSAATGGLFNLGGILGAALGLPGRATGGPVAPDRPYLVGERGPELFVPTAAGRIEPSAFSPAREVRVSINVVAPRGADGPQALQRSSRQVASAVRRALAQN
jgi:hypothetical protein